MTTEVALPADPALDSSKLRAGPAAPKPRTAALAKLMQRATTDQSGKGGSLRRRRIVFSIDSTVCEPGAFDEDFELVVEAPSAEQELAAAKKHPQEPAAMLLELVRSCMVSLNGEPLRDSDLSRVAVWEALGMGGRGLVARQWQSICGVTEEAQKKASDSSRLIVG
jgi:hypothetical protein